MAPHVKGGWGLSSRLGCASFPALEDVPLAHSVVQFHLTCTVVALAPRDLSAWISS